jgi:hypothetical protein
MFMDSCLLLLWLTSLSSQLELANEPSRAELLARYDNESSRASSLHKQAETSRAGSLSSPMFPYSTPQIHFNLVIWLLYISFWGLKTVQYL